MIVIPTLPASKPLFRYFILDVDDVAGNDESNQKRWQVADFDLLVGGARVTGATYKSWNGSMTGNTTSNTEYGNTGETSANAGDGSTATKCLDTRNTTGGLVGLWVDTTTPKAVSGYRWYTANDFTNRDMTAWKLYGSVDNTNWTLLSTVTSFSPTTTRLALAGTWAL